MHSQPKARSATKGARIAQAKLLYGDADGSTSSSSYATASASAGPSSLALAAGSSATATLQAMSYTSTATRLSNGRDAAQLLSHLIPELSSYQVAQYPLLRWIGLPGPFGTPNLDFYTLDPIDQSMYLALGALAARSSSADFMIGNSAPNLREVSQNPALRQGVNLCQYGEKRERLAGDILHAAIQKLHWSGAFSATDLKSVVALTVAEMLILVYRDALAFSRRASTEARPFASGAATHLRILAEDHITDQLAPTGWYSVAWTLVIRDSMISIACGRALD